MSKIIDGHAMLARVKALYDKRAVDIAYYNIVKEAVQMEPFIDKPDPRLMAICDLLDTGVPVWLEYNANRVLNESQWVFVDYVVEHGKRPMVAMIRSHGEKLHYPLIGYGVTWRCWTGKPTDEQCQAVAWRENA